MILSGITVVAVIVIVLCSFLFKTLLAKRTLIELLGLSILLVLTGGFSLISDYMRSNDSYSFIGYFLVTIGFLSGLTAFFLKGASPKEN